MMGMLSKVKEAQEKMKMATENLANLTAQGESGAGMVKATVNGHKQLLSLEIDSEAMSDKELMQDLIVAAVNAAIKEADIMSKQELSKAMEGVLPNIPGLDLQSLMSRGL